MIRGALVACMLSACAQELEPGSAPAVSEHAAVPAAPASTAARDSAAVVDAASPHEMKRLRRALSRSAENLRFEQRGARLHVDMAGTFQSATVIVPDAAGQPQRVCLDDASQLDHILGGVQ